MYVIRTPGVPLFLTTGLCTLVWTQMLILHVVRYRTTNNTTHTSFLHERVYFHFFSKDLNF
jgi:hypothetical protein